MKVQTSYLQNLTTTYLSVVLVQMLPSKGNNRSVHQPKGETLVEGAFSQDLAEADVSKMEKI